MRRADLPRLVLTLLALSAMAAACEQTPPPPSVTADEPRAVVLSLDEAPTWAKAGAVVEVRDEHDAVLLNAPLEGAPPILVDVTVSPAVHELAVAVRAPGHEAKAQARIEGGYANCKLH